MVSSLRIWVWITFYIVLLLVFLLPVFVLLSLEGGNIYPNSCWFKSIRWIPQFYLFMHTHSDIDIEFVMQYLLLSVCCTQWGVTGHHEHVCMTWHDVSPQLCCLQYKPWKIQVAKKKPTKTEAKPKKVFSLLCHYLNLRAWFAEKSECTFSSTWNETIKWMMQWFVLHDIVSHGLLGMSAGWKRHWDFSQDTCTSEEKELYICCTHSPQQSYLILGAVDAQDIKQHSSPSSDKKDKKTRS